MIYDSHDEIIIIEDFLSINHLKKLSQCARDIKEEMWRGYARNDHDFWDGRFYHASDVRTNISEQVSLIMFDQRKRVMQIIEELFDKDKIYSDLCQFVRWFDGYELQPHADSMNPDGSIHPFPYREFASITYLNDDFEGGEIYFPNKDNFSPKIKSGMLVIFPGTVEYLHGVKSVSEGTRYTIASFYTTKSEYADNECA